MACLSSELSTIGLGQGIALLAASANASSFTLEYHFAIQLPMFLMCCMYFILFLIHYVLYAQCIRRRSTMDEDTTTTSPSNTTTVNKNSDKDNDNDPDNTTDCTSSSVLLQQHPIISQFHYYLFFATVSCLDVFSNYLTLLSLHYTSSLISTTLLGSLTVPSTMIASKWILRKSFAQHHHVGVWLCVLGGTLMLWCDQYQTNNNTTNNSSNMITTATTRGGGGGGGSHHDAWNWMDVFYALPLSKGEKSLVATAADPAMGTQHQHHQHDEFWSTNVLLGDGMAIVAAVLYGLGDTLAEYSIQHMHRRVDYMTMIGFFGTIWTALIFPWLEGKQLLAFWMRITSGETEYTSSTTIPPEETSTALSSTTTTPSSSIANYMIVGTMIWYIGSVVAYYMSASFFLQSSDATMLNLSLQSVNLWSVVFSIVVYRKIPSMGFYIAVVLVVSGVVLYECGGGSSGRCNREDSCESFGGDIYHSRAIISGDDIEEQGGTSSDNRGGRIGATHSSGNVDRRTMMLDRQKNVQTLPFQEISHNQTPERPIVLRVSNESIRHNNNPTKQQDAGQIVKSRCGFGYQRLVDTRAPHYHAVTLELETSRN